MYQKINWVDAPSTNTPLNAENLNHMDKAIATLDSEVDVILSRTRTNITSKLSNLSQAVSEQNLAKYGYKIGDYFTGASGYTYILADYNTFKSTSNNYANVADNHVAIVVDTGVNVQWTKTASISTTEGGYVASGLHKYLVETVLPNVKTDIATLLGDSWDNHLISHQKLYSTAVDGARYNRFGQAGGASSSWAWSTNQYISALTENQMFGSIAWSSSGYDTGEAFKKLEVFDLYNPQQIFRQQDVWSRGVASSTSAPYLRANGFADAIGASYSLRAVGLILFH